MLVKILKIILILYLFRKNKEENEKKNLMEEMKKKLKTIFKIRIVQYFSFVFYYITQMIFVRFCCTGSLLVAAGNGDEVKNTYKTKGCLPTQTAF